MSCRPGKRMSACGSIPPREEVGPLQGSPEHIESSLPSAARTVTICNSLGLHMRPVMQFVDLANQFPARIRVIKGEHVVDGKNPMELMLLEATRGSQLEIQAEGHGAEDAVEALVALIQRGFGEE